METSNAVLEQPPVDTTNVPPVTQAPAKPEQLGLIGFVDDAIGKVFAPKAITGKDGVVVGTSVSMRPRKELGKAFSLEGKDNKAALDRAILGMSDAAFKKVQSEIVALGSDWTLHKTANRTVAKGIRQITVVVREIKRNAGPSDEEIAKAWNCTVETVRMMRERQVAALAEQEKNTIEIPPAAPDAPKADEAPAAEQE